MNLGCRAGENCPFVHDPTRLAERPLRTQGQEQELSEQGSSQTTAQAASPGRQYVAPPVDSSRVVQRPTAIRQVVDPREYELSQLRRRFSVNEEEDSNGSALTFKLVPSDPDFPFDIEALECTLYVPLSYPSSGKPRLRVTNEEMDRGYQLNVERGLDALASRAPRPTLLSLMNALDRQLETLLSVQKAEPTTIKIVANAPKPAAKVNTQGANQAAPPKPTPLTTATPRSRAVPAPVTHTAEDKAQAQARRESEIRQIEARLGRLPLYFKSSDGLAYTIPIEPRKRQELPAPLQAIKTVRLIVPESYNLVPCRVELMGVDKDAAAPVEKAFEDRVSQNPQMALVNHINYLSQNMHTMATPPVVVVQQEPEPVPDVSSLTVEDRIEEPQPDMPHPATVESLDAVTKSHIIKIPRPPEWAAKDGDKDDSDGSFSYDTGDETEDEDAPTVEQQQADVPASKPERGIMLSFPHLELHSIELLELVSLSITVKCDRCKDTMDIPSLRNNAKGDYTGIRAESCKKCANSFGIGD
ncbi:hypothetical protein W97_07909 [Coniosporium apollinis CBS 100218]|uniref:C3H1-type domain-containing protein n=1 Tax=Coniosporium apollinis (strain CBS 100218) TaxID=1168221 RepID=R7Z421_CONA1|nr:uncharacterized protein W97_07909 [Coniosporium apollinis CBS 100218]EON68651.1 hypothetical protein W97_07909 [Coniosporium apollinis CBS 100218]